MFSTILLFLINNAKFTIFINIILKNKIIIKWKNSIYFKWNKEILTKLLNFLFNHKEVYLTNELNEIITNVGFNFSLKNINLNEEIFFMKDISIKKNYNNNNFSIIKEEQVKNNILKIYELKVVYINNIESLYYFISKIKKFYFYYYWFRRSFIIIKTFYKFNTNKWWFK